MSATSGDLYEMTPESASVIEQYWPDSAKHPTGKSSAKTKAHFQQQMDALQIALIERWMPTMPADVLARANHTIASINAKYPQKKSLADAFPEAV